MKKLNKASWIACGLTLFSSSAFATDAGITNTVGKLTVTRQGPAPANQTTDAEQVSSTKQQQVIKMEMTQQNVDALTCPAGAGNGTVGADWHGAFEAQSLNEKSNELSQAIQGLSASDALNLISQIGPNGASKFLATLPGSWDAFKTEIRNAEQAISSPGLYYSIVVKNGAANEKNLGYLVSTCTTAQIQENMMAPTPETQDVSTKTANVKIQVSGAPLAANESESFEVTYDGSQIVATAPSGGNIAYNFAGSSTDSSGATVMSFNGVRTLTDPSNDLEVEVQNQGGEVVLLVTIPNFDSSSETMIGQRTLMASLQEEIPGAHFWNAPTKKDLGGAGSNYTLQTQKTQYIHTGIHADSKSKVRVTYALRVSGSILFDGNASSYGTSEYTDFN